MANCGKSAYRPHGMPSRRFPRGRPSEAARARIILAITALFRMQALLSVASARP
jgi:hypothetical protein